MRLKFKTGIEFTWCAAAPLRNDDAYTNLCSGFTGVVRAMLNPLGLHPNQVTTEDCVEITFKPFTTWGQIERTYTKMRAALMPIGLSPRNPYHGTGGGHIHQSGFRDTWHRAALYRLVTAHPEINWAFNGPEDTCNAQSWLLGEKMSEWTWTYNAAMRSVRTRHFSRIGAVLYGSRDEMVDTMNAADRYERWPADKDKALNYNSTFGTLEHRYFDAPLDIEELYHQVQFAEAISSYAGHNRMRLTASPLDYPRPKGMAMKLGKERCLTRFLDFVEELGLNPLDYVGLAKPRFDIRWYDGTAR